MSAAAAKQTEANRASALHSTCPTSEAGKARSSRNALRHGFISKDLFVPPSQEAEFKAFKTDLRRDLYSECPAQALLFFTSLLRASWRLLQGDRAEAGRSTRTSIPGLDPALEPTLRTIDRARAEASKEFHKSVTGVRKVQTGHQYRTAAMPGDEGGDTRCVGLGDRQTIRAPMKKERAIDGANLGRGIWNQQIEPNEQNEPKSVAEVEALMDLLSQLQELERIRRIGLGKTNPNRSPKSKPSWIASGSSRSSIGSAGTGSTKRTQIPS